MSHLTLSQLQVSTIIIWKPGIPDSQNNHDDEQFDVNSQDNDNAKDEMEVNAQEQQDKVNKAETPQGNMGGMKEHKEAASNHQCKPNLDEWEDDEEEEDKEEDDKYGYSIASCPNCSRIVPEGYIMIGCEDMPCSFYVTSVLMSQEEGGQQTRRRELQRQQ